MHFGGVEVLPQGASLVVELNANPGHSQPFANRTSLMGAYVPIGHDCTFVADDTDLDPLDLADLGGRLADVRRGAQ
jgi:hypothetical protein